MRLDEVLDLLTERKGKEGKEGEEKSTKSRVKTFATIKQALSDGSYGQIFTTKGADRLYVISKGKWGSKSGRGKIAKGFTPGSSTPSSEFGSIKKHAARTILRYGKGSKALAKRYGSRSIKQKKGLPYQ